jgi:predicted enzyme related to lactoylglutathione lyase
MTHRIEWFDIPVTGLERAEAFYRNVLAIDFIDTGPDSPVAVMDHGPGDVAGCLFKNEGCLPSAQGVLIYFPVGGRMDQAVSMVGDYGGSIVEEVQSIAPHGFRAVVLDSEVNRIALHCEEM